MRPADLERWTTASDLALTPDGRTAVVLLSRPDLETNASVSSLWAVPVDGSAPRRLTLGPGDSSPVVSPDGSLVAFVRRVGSVGQVAVLPLGGGEPQVLTDHPLGAGSPVWHPDSNRLAYVVRVPEPGRYGTDKDVDAGAEPPRHITGARYRLDGIGFVNDRRQYVYVIDVPGGNDLSADKPTPAAVFRIGAEETDTFAPAWAPDGDRLAVISRRHSEADTDLLDQVWIYDAPRKDAPTPQAPTDATDTGDAVGAREVVVDTEPTLALDAVLSVDSVVWPEPDVLLLVAAEAGGGRDFVGHARGLFTLTLAPASSSDDDVAAPTRLTDPETVDVADFDGPLPLLFDGDRLASVLVPVRRRGAGLLREYRLGAGGESGTQLTETGAGAEYVIRGAAATRDGSVVVARVSTSTRPGDIAVLRCAEQGRHEPERWLTELSSSLAQGFSPPIELNTQAPDGYPVHGWLYLPDPAEHGEGPYPTLLMIHGGPYTQYTHAAFDETQVLVGAGYAVVMGNPRGSAGYGAAHGMAIKGAMGTVDYDDVMALLDKALVDPRLDHGRVGIMGGSYGGYMTALTTTRTGRFVAAVVERGVLDFPSFSGASDIGWFFGHEYCGDLEAQRAQSPMTQVDSVRTPTLVIHSEHDWRCPVDQGQRWYESLRRNGVHAELLLFPGEGHELSRSGRPRHRLQRFEHLLRWWDQHLGPATR